MLKTPVEITVDQERCKGCDLCLNLCPAKVFQESDQTNTRGFKSRIPALKEQCTSCGLCQYFCPERAIKLEGKSILSDLWNQAERKKDSSKARGGWQKVKTLHPGKHFTNGNVACAWAAVDAGCRFFAGYPITPASEQLHEMENIMPKAGGVFLQMENEDSSMAALCGASLAGAKAMTATSDPGFERMLENLSFAIVNELPMVLALVQRTSPSTGRPTGTGAWLVRGTRWGPHGGTEHIVLYPSTITEIYEYTVKAFNLAEKFRCPVILMMEASNAHLEESFEIPEEIDVFDRIYTPGEPPFGPSDKGLIPSMPRYGDGELLKVTGLTHNPRGVPCESIPQVHEEMIKHLRNKINSKADELTDVEEYLLNDAEVIFVTYGHTARSVRWAVNEARKKQIKAGMLKLRTLYPFPEKVVKKWSKTTKLVIVPEMNQGQLFYVVRESSIAPVISLPQMDGENIDPRRILYFLEHLSLDNYPFPTECNAPVNVDLTEWEKSKSTLPEKKLGPVTPFCPGCGLGILRNALVEGISELNLPREKMVMVSGIGCTARLPNHLPFDSANTTHGYPLPFAAGVKLTQPELNVVVISGDGDLFDIGLGQTLHGARRDLPMLAICFNNFVFGMTGGQVGPTTPINAITLTTTRGNKKPPMDLVRLMLDLNVGFVARCPTSKPLVLKRNIKDALSFKGFSFIEVVSPCLTCYSNKNKLGTANQVWQKLNQTFVDKQQVKNLSADVMREKYNALFPNRAEVQPQELLPIVYGEFSSLKEYIDLVPEVK